MKLRPLSYWSNVSDAPQQKTLMFISNYDHKNSLTQQKPVPPQHRARACIQYKRYFKELKYLFLVFSPTKRLSHHQTLSLPQSDCLKLMKVNRPYFAKLFIDQY